MGSPISVNKRTMIIKQQAVRGTAIAMADADFNIEFFNIEVSKNVAEYQRMYALGDHDRSASTFGKQSASVTASIDLRWSGTVDTTPNLSKAFHACGLLEEVSAGVSVDWNPTKAGDLGGGLVGVLDLPFDVLIQDEVKGSAPKALGTLISGALANGKLILDEGGQPIRIDLEFTGVLESIADIANGSILVATGLDTPLPDSVLSATITNAAIVQRIDTFELDFGNVIEMENDPSDAKGYLAAYIGDRKPTVSINPLADLVANDAVVTRWLASTESILSFATSHYTITATKAQIITNDDDAQNLARANSQTLNLNRDVSTGYPFKITHS